MQEREESSETADRAREGCGPQTGKEKTMRTERENRERLKKAGEFTCRRRVPRAARRPMTVAEVCAFANERKLTYGSAVALLKEEGRK